MGAVALLASACVHATPPPSPSPVDPYEITFFDISDAHIVADAKENTWRLSKDSASIARNTLNEVLAQEPKLVLFSGDVMEGKFYGMKSLKLASEILHQSAIPWFVVAGNHDGRYTKKDLTLDEFDKAEFYKGFKGHGPDGVVGYWRYDVQDRLITFIGLDTSKDGSSEGIIDDRQMTWLKAALNDIPKERFVVVVMHHPAIVFDKTILDPDKKEKLRIFVLNNQAELRSVLEAHKNVKLVVSGHTHARGHIFVNGIHYVSSPSINSWPCEYTKFSLSRRKIAYKDTPISARDKIDEALRALTAPDSDWMKIFRNTTAVKAYFSHGPTKETLAVSQ